MAKQIHEMQKELDNINKEGIKKKIYLDLTMDGYEMVKAKPVDTHSDKSPEDSVKNLLSTLTEKEAAVLIHRYGLLGHSSKTLENTGTLIGNTRERVRQLQSKALKKCRHPNRKDLVKKLTHRDLKSDILGD